MLSNKKAFNSYFRFAEKLFAVFGLMYFSEGLSNDNIIPEILISLFRYLVLALSILFISLRFKKALRSLLKDPFLIVLIIVTFASVLWSVNPESTVVSLRSQFVQMIAFSLFLATGFTLREQLELVAFSLGLSALLSTFYAVAIPSVGKHVTGSFTGAWKGLYSQKNILSALMVLSSVAFACLSDRGRSWRLVFRFGFYLSLTLVLLSTSKTGLLSSIFLIVFLFLWRRFRWRGEVSVIGLDLGILAAASLVGIVIDNWEPILVGLGRDPTLTGRTLIWGATLDMLVQDQFWLGYGRDAFWYTNAAVEVGAAVAPGYIPPHAHNGFIDLMIDLGLVGLFAFGLSFIHNLVRATRKAYAARSGEDLWPLAFLAFLLISNITESALMRFNSIYWVVYVAIAFSNFTSQPQTTVQEPEAVSMAYKS